MVFETCEQIISGNFEGNISELIAQCPFVGGFAGGALGALMIFGILIAIIFMAGIYVYSSLAWYTIAKKLKYKKAWLAWIPIINTTMVLQLGGFHWAWIFLILIPILGWIALFVLAIIANWRIFEKRKYPGWFGLAPIIPKIGGILYLIVIGFVAWKDQPKRK